jgi:hypothetical protein
LTAQISPRVDLRTQPFNPVAALTEIVERISHIPGVISASMVSNGVPLGGGATLRSSPSMPDAVSVRRVMPDYHRALKIPLRNGRFFSGTDRAGSLPVVIVNAAAAKKYFPGEDPIGRPFSVDGDRTVVGASSATSIRRASKRSR